MEIQILSPTNGQPLPPVEWNYTEVKAWLESGLERYKGVVYDESQMGVAKADRANLRKLAEAIDAKRREMKKTYLQPYEEFEAQAKELVAMIKQQVDAIDVQVKAYENFRKQEKRAKIEAELYVPMIGNLAELVPYDRLHEAKWLNVTCSMNTVGNELARKIENIHNGLNVIGKMDLPDDIKEQGKIKFLERFDLGAAVSSMEHIVEQRAALERLNSSKTELEARKAQENPTPVKISNPETETVSQDHSDGDSQKEKIYTVSFRVNVTSAQLKALGDFMRVNGIKPERI